MKTTPIFLFSILLLGACGGPAARVTLLYIQYCFL